MLIINFKNMNKSTENIPQNNNQIEIRVRDFEKAKSAIKKTSATIGKLIEDCGENPEQFELRKSLEKALEALEKAEESL